MCNISLQIYWKPEIVLNVLRAYAVFNRNRIWFNPILCYQVCLRGNGVYDNGGHGILVSGEMEVNNNDVLGNRKSCICLLPGAQALVHLNFAHIITDSVNTS